MSEVECTLVVFDVTLLHVMGAHKLARTNLPRLFLVSASRVLTYPPGGMQYWGWMDTDVLREFASVLKVYQVGLTNIRFECKLLSPAVVAPQGQRVRERVPDGI